MSSSKGWIGVDLDGTLAHYEHFEGLTYIGPPVPAMLDRVKAWLAAGYEVRIFTARMSDGKDGYGKTKFDFVTALGSWLKAAGLPFLVPTNVKDFQMIELWDDRAVQVVPNTGKPVGSSPRGL